MSNKFLASAALGTAVALSGCGSDEKDAKSQSVQRCEYGQNIFYANPENSNDIGMYAKGLIHSVLKTCYVDRENQETLHGSVLFNRAPSFSKPSTGKVSTNNVPDAQAMNDFIAQLNIAPHVGEGVRPYATLNKKAEIHINPGSSSITTASPEGNTSGGDLSMIQPDSHTKGNTEIARLRSENIIQAINTALRQTGAQVTGLENIEYKSSQTYLTPAELGELYTMALKLYGNGDNRVMQLVADYNTGKLSLSASDAAMLREIIDAKRKGDVTLVVTAKGTKQTIEVSNWSYAILLFWLGIAGAVSVRKINKMGANTKTATAK